MKSGKKVDNTLAELDASGAKKLNFIRQNTSPRLGGVRIT